MSAFIHKETYPAELVMSQVRFFEHYPKDSTQILSPEPVSFDGDLIKLNTKHFLVWKTKGLSCITCGITGTIFKKRIDKREFKGGGSFKLFLFALRPHKNAYKACEKHVAMTLDHVYPKSKGGPNGIANLVPMCSECNGKKGDTIA